MMTLQQSHRTRRSRYFQHRRNAKKRGVLWDLTYVQWSIIWARSGHWHERGKKRGRYVMARYGDIGPYIVGNVRICTFEENRVEAMLGKRGSAHPRWGAKHSVDWQSKKSKAMQGKNNPMWGQTHTAMTRIKISTAALGRTSPMKGKRHSPESLAKMSESKKGMRNPNFGKRKI